ncbi:MAG: flagellar biosynthesis protein FlhF [Gammaproteobacteria bacterium]|nr:flagellar biosynthesis protein FlhF [Gammaproteobacteria bacterium]
MKIVRHTAPDMRQALRSIREQLGEDAVILSSKRCPEGVEVTAAIDFDATSLQPQPAVSAPLESLAPAPRASVSVTAARAAMPGAAASRVRQSPVAAATPLIPAVAAAQSPTLLPEDAFLRVPAPEAAGLFAPAIAAMLAPQRAPAAAVLTAPSQVSPAFIPPAPVTASATGAPATAAITASRESAAFSFAQQATPEATTLTPAKHDLAAAVLAEFPAQSSVTTLAGSDAMGTELKTLRRMLETQLAQLAWNDLTRRAPVHVEILRELTEIGISQDLSDYLLKQLPDKVELGFARRFAIAGLSQYLLVTGDRWLENGGRVAFIGATGVGKTTTLAKLAVRWVLRHGPRDIALVGSDTVRIGAQAQIQSLGQMLGVPVYTPENFESLPTLLSRLDQRLILIDTPGSSLRDTQLVGRLSVLANSASRLETAVVLAASTQAGALEETVKRFAPANPSCCVLTKVDEAASLGGALSVLIRARLPISYTSEGQRVPEDLRPARALELVSTAVRLAKASGAAADEDLLRRRFGKTANAIT